jgi:predicted NBD/HSP70 family sugar kinase
VILSRGHGFCLVSASEIQEAWLRKLALTIATAVTLLAAPAIATSSQAAELMQFKLGVLKLGATAN